MPRVKDYFPKSTKALGKIDQNLGFKGSQSFRISSMVGVLGELYAKRDTREVPGKKNNPHINNLYMYSSKWLGKPSAKYRPSKQGNRWIPSDNHFPWCAVQGSVILNMVRGQLGYKNEKMAFAAQKIPRTFNLSEVKKPQLGDVVVFKRSGALGHTGFLVGTSKDGSKIMVMGGNQNNSFNITEYPNQNTNFYSIVQRKKGKTYFNERERTFIGKQYEDLRNTFKKLGKYKISGSLRNTR